MNKIEKLIDEMCPDGVEFRVLREVCQISAGGDLPENHIKGQDKPSKEFQYPIYSNGSNEKALYGYTDNYKIDKDAVTISARGTIGYHSVRRAKFTPIVRLITLIPSIKIITVKFLNYVLDITAIGHSGGSIPQLTIPNVKKIKIPIPPLTIQKEIVKILDNFTRLEAELEAELEARKKQYEYYREELLRFGDDVEFRALGEVCNETNNIRWKNNIGKIFQYIDLTSVDRETRTISETKTIDAGNAPSRAQKIVEQGDILFGTTRPTLKRYCLIDNVLDKQICSTGFCVLRPKTDKVITNFIYHLIGTLTFYNYVEAMQKGASYPAISDTVVKKFKIPIPPLTEQNRIVAILDKFDALVNDISTGLPAEIAARKKQYEYYRNQLLTFKKRADMESSHAGQKNEI